MNEESPCKFCDKEFCPGLCQEAETWFKQIESSLPEETVGSESYLLLTDMKAQSGSALPDDNFLHRNLKRGNELAEIRKAVADRVGTKEQRQKVVSKIKRQYFGSLYPRRGQKRKEREWLAKYLECWNCAKIAEVSGFCSEYVRKKIIAEMKRLKTLMGLTTPVQKVRDLKMGIPSDLG